ncbi:hypothetical protein [Roseovarius sp. D22-M7]|uniref:hypothetical protein n=1 Tax=Roseovarius sp. D22-M7 TaxID=3127116 RepID=UPI00300FAA30
MTEAAEMNAFTTLQDFYNETEGAVAPCGSRIVHCVNPFPAAPGSEHDRAQRVTFDSMTRARSVSRQLQPQLDVRFAKVTDAQDVSSSLIAFDDHCRIDRTVTDLADFKIPRPLPIMMDVLTAVPVDPDDIFIFTNVDIALVSGFYGFIEAIFSRGTDCAIINRRTISGIYEDERDLSLMACEAGAPHPGFDCFAFRGRLRDALLPYESCVGIGGVMQPLLHQLLALAERPVVLVDAHATYHLGNDRQWAHEDFSDYLEHNRREIDRVFQALLDDPAICERMVKRLLTAPRPGIFPNRLRVLAGLPEQAAPRRRNGLARRVRSAMRRVLTQ